MAALFMMVAKEEVRCGCIMSDKVCLGRRSGWADGSKVQNIFRWYSPNYHI